MGIRYGRSALALATLLAACGGSSSPSTAPTNVVVTPGDGQVVVSFDSAPNLTYWIFYAKAASITRSNYSGFPGANAVNGAVSPQVINRLVNGVQYAFLMNITSGGPAGPSSPSVAAMPRPAGNNFVFGPQVGAANYRGLAYGALASPLVPTLVAVGSGGAVLTDPLQPGGTLLSSNGTAPWTVRSTGATADLNAVVYDAALAKFCAVGANGTELTSADGVTWTPATTSGTTADLYGVTAFGQALVAVGAGGTIVTSPDGVTWTVQTSNTNNDLLGVNFTGGYLLAVGRAGTMLTSTDTVNWARVAVPTNADLHDVTYGVPNPYGAGTGVAAWIAVGSGGTILSNNVAPPSQTPWTQLTQAVTSQTLNAVTVGSRFAAAGNGGAVVYSDDGVTWQLAIDPDTNDLAALRYVAGVYFGVGAAGGSVTSY